MFVEDGIYSVRVTQELRDGFRQMLDRLGVSSSAQISFPIQRAMMRLCWVGEKGNQTPDEAAETEQRMLELMHFLTEDYGLRVGDLHPGIRCYSSWTRGYARRIAACRWAKELEARRQALRESMRRARVLA